MRVNEPTLLSAQRTKLDALQEAARASGDRELQRVCALALEQGPQTFDITLDWVGGRLRKGEHRSRVRSPIADQYVILHGNENQRWMAGEVGARLPTFPDTDGVMVLLEEVRRTALYREAPGPRPGEHFRGEDLRKFFFFFEEVAPFTKKMGYAPSGLWSVLPYGSPQQGVPLIAAESAGEAITRWRAHTRSRIPLSELWAIQRIRSSEGREKIFQPPSHVVLVSAAERSIRLTQAVQNRLAKGARVPFQEFYASWRFQDSLSQARGLAEDEHIHLLSALFGLLPLWGAHTRATSDDVPLKDMSPDARQAWARRINSELLEAYGAGPRVFVVFAGLEYVQLLQEWALDGARWTFEAGETS